MVFEMEILPPNSGAALLATEPYYADALSSDRPSLVGLFTLSKSFALRIAPIWE